MRTTYIFIATLLIHTLLFNTSTNAKNHFDYKTININNHTTIQNIESLTLREDLPSYVFEYDLERLYPATYEFYKKLDIINRDNVYSYYLYHPEIKDVRHKIIQLAIGKNQGKTTPVPFSINQALATIKNKEIINDTNTHHTSLRLRSFN